MVGSENHFNILSAQPIFPFSFQNCDEILFAHQFIMMQDPKTRSFSTLPNSTFFQIQNDESGDNLALFQSILFHSEISIFSILNIKLLKNKTSENQLRISQYSQYSQQKCADYIFIPPFNTLIAFVTSIQVLNLPKIKVIAQQITQVQISKRYSRKVMRKLSLLTNCLQILRHVQIQLSQIIPFIAFKVLQSIFNIDKFAIVDNCLMSQQQSDQDFQSVDSDQSLSAAEEVEAAIRQLPSLEEKIQAIAINHYLLQKRELDQKLEADISKLEYQIRNSYNKELHEIYQIVEGTFDYCDDQLSELENYKELFKEGEIEKLRQTVKGDEDKFKGIQSYWYSCMRASDIIAQQIQPEDEGLLMNLQKIQASSNEEGNKLSVTFSFAPNKWIENEKVKKNFELNSEGKVVRSYGDTIEWKDGMNYTVKKVNKKSKKNKGKKTAKEEQIKVPSFFHFFTDIDSKDDKDSDLDIEAQEELFEDLELQYELSEHIFKDFIPKSLQFYVTSKQQKH